MYNCNVNIEIDVFKKKKERILKNLSDDDLENEIERRNILNIIVDESDLDISFDVDISEFNDEIVDNLETDELIREIENRCYTVYSDDEIPNDITCSRSGIAELLGLKWWSTKEQILKELENTL